MFRAVARRAVLAATLAAVPATVLAAPVGAVGPDGSLDRFAAHHSGTSARTAAASVAGDTCFQADGTTPAICPTISEVTTVPSVVRAGTADILVDASITYSDPDNLINEGGVVVGRYLTSDTTQNPIVVGFDHGMTMAQTAEPGVKKFTGKVHLSYKSMDWNTGEFTGAPQYGDLQVLGYLSDGTFEDPNYTEALSSRYLNLKAKSVVTNTPSATTVSKGQWFTIRGTLKRFDGTPQTGQKVNIYYVPSGSTKASFAGTATASSTGALSLNVRSWYSGSWFINYPGSAFSTNVYQAKWVAVR